MKSIAKISVFAAGLTVVVILADVAPGFGASHESQTSRDLVFDVACDCRTGVSGTNRNDPFIIQGKIFPAGTLPTGTATNDPTKPVRGVAPIGDWLCRGQNSHPLPPDIFPAYSSTPFAFNAQYFMLNGGGTFVAEGLNLPDKGVLALTGGIGRFSGASGDIEGRIFGTNVTGCPNFRATFNILPGSIRGNSNH